MSNIGAGMEQYGIEILAVETKQLDLPSDNKMAVYERMISSRSCFCYVILLYTKKLLWANPSTAP